MFLRGREAMAALGLRLLGLLQREVFFTVLSPPFLPVFLLQPILAPSLKDVVKRE